MSILEYDFAKHDWEHGGSMNPLSVRDCVSILKTLLDGDCTRYEITTDGGWPRVGWGRVVSVGERHGVPSVSYMGVFGTEVVPWHLLSDVRYCVVRGSREEG